MPYWSKGEGIPTVDHDSEGQGVFCCQGLLLDHTLDEEVIDISGWHADQMANCGGGAVGMLGGVGHYPQ